MKKLVAMLLVVGVIGVFAAGCSGGGEATADQAKTPAPAEKKEGE